MENLPLTLVYQEIFTKLPPQDQLSLAFTCKPFYATLASSAFPAFKERYSHKYKVAMCLLDMIKFISTGSPFMAKWGFAYNNHIKTKTKTSCSIMFHRVDKHTFVSINDIPSSAMTSPKVILEWFQKHIFPHWDHIQFHTGCWYKNPQKRREFLNMSMRMNELLASSIQNPNPKHKYNIRH